MKNSLLPGTVIINCRMISLKDGQSAGILKVADSYVIYRSARK